MFFAGARQRSRGTMDFARVSASAVAALPVTPASVRYATYLPTAKCTPVALAPLPA